MKTQYRMKGAAVHVLLVEDNNNDIDITIETMERSKVMLNMDVVRDGEEALAYLRKEESYADAIRPDMILLDLNMPKMSGRELLEIIKDDSQLKVIPVVVLSTSDSDKDILKAYEMQISCYLKKPVGLQEFKELVQKMDQFWFSLVKYPPHLDEVQEPKEK